MNFNPKAPPVYKPNPQRVAAPPAYRPQEGANGVQSKPTSHFRSETRPAPLVYRPQSAKLSSAQQKPAEILFHPRSRYESRAQEGIRGQQIQLKPGIRSTAVDPISIHLDQKVERTQAHRRNGTGAILIETAAQRTRRNGNTARALERRSPPRIFHSVQLAIQQRPTSGNTGFVQQHNPKMMGNEGVRQTPATFSREISGFRRAVHFVIQRTAMETDVKEKELESYVRVEDSSEAISPVIVSEVENIVKAAEKAGGKESNAHGGLEGLKEILTNETVAKAAPSDSESTYAIASDGTTVYASGAQKFVSAVQSVAENAENLGTRQDFVHGESHIFQKKPGIKSVAATQPNCLFCYGFLETQKIDHQTLRDSPFPKGWIHPKSNFKLTQTNPQWGPKGKLLWISFKGGTPRLYRVE